MMFRSITPNAYYLRMDNKTDYFDLMRNQLTVSANYMIDFNSCQVSKTEYLVAQQNGSRYSVNQEFGVVTDGVIGDWYIASSENFSNGLNGGN